MAVVNELSYVTQALFSLVTAFFHVELFVSVEISNLSHTSLIAQVAEVLQFLLNCVNNVNVQFIGVMRNLQMILCTNLPWNPDWMTCVFCKSGNGNQCCGL